MRRCVVRRKIALIDARAEQIDELMSTAVESPTDASRLQIHLAIVNQIEASPNSPVLSAARTASAVALAILPSVLALGISLIFGESGS